MTPQIAMEAMRIRGLKIFFKIFFFDVDHFFPQSSLNLYNIASVLCFGFCLVFFATKHVGS